jgi:superfamily II DNA or RNA helicase
MKTSITLRDYQIQPFNFLYSDFEKLVLAMCPSSGKTETVIYFIDQMFKENNDLKVLILPHSTNVLLNNFYDRLEQRNVGFTYSTDTSVECNVHIVLPQSKSKIKNKYDLLIIDEAHENYFAETVQNIIRKTNPKKQILLTGTPYKFVGRDDFKIHFLSLNELDKNTIPKLRVDIIESNYQWNGNYNSLGEVKKEFDFNDNDTKATLNKTFKFILKRGKNSISKTLIVCNNIKQSEYVKNYLDDIGLSSVISNSKNDTKSELIQDFKQNKINILIVVNRARLGYDDSDLINLIDMSGTLNPNLIYQMIARVLRGSNDTQKYYVRLTSKKDESLNSEIATNLALMLTDKKYISTFNGKNFNNQLVIVPNFFSKKYITTSSNFSKNTPKLLLDTDDMISFYRDTISDIDKEYGVYKFCKIKDVLIELGTKKKFNQEISLENLKRIALNYNGRFEWQKKDQKTYSYAKNQGWLDECCKHMKQLRRQYTLESCKESASKFKTIRDWDKADTNSVCASRRNGWYKECIAHMDSLLVFRTLEQCKESASKYTLKEDWKKGDYNSYQASRINGWYEECTAHMKNTFIKYTLEYCKKVALKYNSNAEFYKSEFNVYCRANQRGWLDECRKHMPEVRKFRKNINLDTCVEIASNFYTESQWKKSDLISYNKARKNGWLEECVKHFKK